MALRQKDIYHYHPSNSLLPPLYDFLTLMDDMVDVPQAPRLLSGGGGRSDFVENDKEYRITMDLPGLGKDKIKMELNNNGTTLNVSASYDETRNNTDDDKVIWRERRVGSVYRKFSFNTPVRSEDITASLNEGVLQIKVFKNVEKAGSSLIQIQ